MTYALYDPTKPDAATQAGTAFGQSVRDNLNALRDAAILGGGFVGFNLAAIGGTASQPSQLLYSKGTERVRATLTWGTVGGEAGNVTVAVYAYASDAATYSAIGIKTITYDANANVTATTWS